MSRFDLHLEQLPPGTSLLERYTQVCEREGMQPFRPILGKLSKSYLEVNLDMITKNDLIIVLYALVNDDTITGIKFESRLLKENPELTNDARKLRLHSQGRRLPVFIEPEVMSSLCNALHRHISRNELNLKVLRINGLPMTEGELEIICSALSASKSVRLLSLEGVPLSGKHLDVLFSIIPMVPSLTILNLAQCSIGRNEVVLICRFLHTEKKLERLILNGNPIGDSGVEHLVKALRQHSVLRALDLQNCGLTSVGCNSLQELVSSNTRFEVCDIRRNTAVTRHHVLRLAEQLLENNKWRNHKDRYHALALDMSPTIDASKIAFEDLGLNSVRFEPPTPREVPSVRFPPKDLQLEVQINDPSKIGQTKPEKSPAKNGVFISNESLAKFESSLSKFQVLLDYLQTEHLRRARREPHNIPHDSADMVQQPEAQRPEAMPRQSVLQSTEGHSVKMASTLGKASPTSLKDASQSSLNDDTNPNKSLTHKSYSDSFVASKTSSVRSTRRDTSPVSGQRFQTSSDSTLGPSRSGSTVKKDASVENGSSAPNDDDNVDGKPIDRTITSDHELDNQSFEFNFDDVGGITKESSYLRLAGEVFDDHKDILESTRVSMAPTQSSSCSSKRNSGSSSKTNSDTKDLEERLKNIQSKYNLASATLRSVVSVSNEARRDPPNGKTSTDNLPDSWAIDQLNVGKESVDLSDVSLGSSFSGDLTGSDLDKF